MTNDQCSYLGIMSFKVKKTEHVQIIQALLIVGLILFAQVGFCQKFVEDIRLGDRMPENILAGGFTEIPGENPSARNFLIEYDLPNYETTGKKGEAISIFEQNDTVIGIIKITGRAGYVDALQAYIFRLSYFINTLSQIPGRELLTVRYADGTKHDGKYYFAYTEENGTEYYVTGLIGDQIIEEKYIKGSNYQNVLKN